MASNKLTDAFIKSVKPKVSPYSLTDGEGLSLLVNPTGKMAWRYRYRFAGKANLLSLGGYPVVTLKSAREQRSELRKTILSGNNPSALRKQKKTALIQKHMVSNTFKNIAKEWHSHWLVGKAPRSAKSVWQRLEFNIFSDLGDLPISDITAKMLKSTIGKLGERGATSGSKRMLNTCSQIFSYAVHKEIIFSNPAREIDPKLAFKSHVKNNYARLTIKELPDLLRAIDLLDQYIPRLGLKLMTYTFVRTAELLNARWSEIDLVKSEWHIPAERMKMGKPHIVALSTQVLAIFKELYAISGGRTFVFPNAVYPNKSIGVNTLIFALYKLGYKGSMTSHGFRGIASTILHEQGYNHQHIELQLAHSTAKTVSGAYNYADYLVPRATMLQDWADFIDVQKTIHGRSL